MPQHSCVPCMDDTITIDGVAAALECGAYCSISMQLQQAEHRKDEVKIQQQTDNLAFEMQL